MGRLNNSQVCGYIGSGANLYQEAGVGLTYIKDDAGNVGGMGLTCIRVDEVGLTCIRGGEWG